LAATVIDGKAIAKEIRSEIKADVERLRMEYGVTPGLAVVLVGENPASVSYVRAKQRACEDAGIYSEQHNLPEDTPEEELLELVRELNAKDEIHGVLVQLPLPRHMDEGKVLEFISPDKDVDGFHPSNVGRMVIGKPRFLPCTPYGIQQLLIRSGVDPGGKHVVVVGRSNIVGKPIANILLQKKGGANATVTVCHTGTVDMAAFTRQADILIVAAGRPKVITADMVKEGAVVIDVGVNRVDDPTAKRGYRLVGDVDFESVKEKAGMITPVPGGVGPMTIAMLLHNTVLAAKFACGIE